MRHSHATRRGLTLIEMLIVMAVIVALLGLTAAVAPRLGDRQRASRGAAQLQAWLNIAKQRAIRSVAEGDPRPYGVRLVPPSGQPHAQYVRECLYIETPTAFTGGVVMSPYDNDLDRLQAPPTEAPDRYKFVLLQGVELPLTGNAAVQPGDILDMYEIYPGEDPRRIVSIAFVPATGPGSYPKYPFDHYRIELDGEPGARFRDFDPRGPAPAGSPFCKQSRKPTYTDHSTYPTANPPTTTYPTTPPPVTAAYRIYRQPRPVPGEPVLLFPKDVGIDISRQAHPNELLPTYTPPPAGWTPSWYRTFPKFNPGGGAPFDIVFDPSGRVTGGIGFDSFNTRWIGPTPALGTSRICLWVREVSKDYTTGSELPEGDNSLITIYTRSGLVAAHPVATTTTQGNRTVNLLDWTGSNGNYWDPFYLTHTAQSSGQ